MNIKSPMGITHLIASILVSFGLLFGSTTYYAQAQAEPPDGPIYLVQTGDSLWDIALRFGIAVQDLAKANDIQDWSLLAAGQELVIPGLEGVSGYLATRTVDYGENLRSLSRRYSLSELDLSKLNHISSPAQLFAGYNLIVPEQAGDAQFQAGRTALEIGQTPLELSVLHGVNPWSLVISNTLAGTVQALPGDVLVYRGEPRSGPIGLPEDIQSLEIAPLPILQGKTEILRVLAPEGTTINAELMGHETSFFPEDSQADGMVRYVGMQGVHALAEPGLYRLGLTGTTSDGAPFAFSQNVFLQSVNYPYDRPLTVDPETVDPAITGPEDELWNALPLVITPERYWDGIFTLPSALPAQYCLDTGECWSSRFGNRRSYNGGPYNAFHTGLDIIGQVGAEIFAPAPGVVVFADTLTVRGNATMIDHGWGIYTGYMHQSEILVESGQRVETGELIGLVGDTGRVEGPHLHWEVWVNGVRVDPLDWLFDAYP